MGNQLTATFRVSTPMFLGGADQTSEAELRPASIKGALRFWWRALAWSEGVQNAADLREKEAALFGSSETGQSRFQLWLENPLVETNQVTEKWHPTSWKQYTGYGLRDKDKGERRFIQAGREFTVHFNTHRCDVAQRSQLVRAIQAFGLLGGLGSRSRKGWGSISLTKLEGADFACPDNENSWRAAVSALIASSAQRNAQQLPPWTAFSKASLHNSAPPQPNTDAAQEWLGKQYQAWVKDTFPKANRAQFGLPRDFKRDREGTRPRPERRASPLLLHIHQCASGRALPTAVWLPATFLPTETSLPNNGADCAEFVEKLSPP
jgi:CRISPR-associated protein Cmr1